MKERDLQIFMSVMGRKRKEKKDKEAGNNAEEVPGLQYPVICHQVGCRPSNRKGPQRNLLKKKKK